MLHGLDPVKSVNSCINDVEKLGRVSDHCISIPKFLVRLYHWTYIGRHPASLVQPSGLNGQVTCWGGDNCYEQTSPPTDTFADVQAGGSHSCGLKADHSLMCWGSNYYGELEVPNELFL